ncbi:MAG TPA: LacI family DNA-binding transcriptional regulator [Dictyoglomaceae bacterium]|nr:LacI family DNA-binding transcriptional regulator [Dictyoglomaceae bacterium]HOL39423.1 LacI family DNA-binding transcriptional regulator [Dictyoglomaceae bacterium]HOP95539.1 LacI family DNA-binding transcriptional regulator [Dictyoglomaceae bacterium]HPP16384.1 LacI family DNA-binding transcriptional regulator [Dictyoglomaceae bacterium]HPU43482.1 LacI family DNA-binding transcriptional regulator [Dictyoglomaceae bacterium]
MPRKKKKVTIKNIAEKAGVSIGTVSRVMNKADNVNEELKEKVLKTAISLGYEFELKKKGVLGTVGFVIRELENDPTQNVYFSKILRGAQKRVEELGGKLVYTVVPNTDDEIPEVVFKIKNLGVDALLLVNLSNQKLVEEILKFSIPSVIMEDYFPDLEVDSISTDGFEGAVKVAKFLSQKHDKIAFIDGPQNQYDVIQRAAGFYYALYKLGKPLNPDLVAYSDLLPEGGYRAMMELLKRGKKFTAVYCTNDNSAIGAMRAIKEKGLKIPEDISVVGNDDIDMASLLDPPLTTMKVFRETLGRVAVDHLYQKIQMPYGPILKIVIPEELIVRKSTI